MSSDAEPVISDAVEAKLDDSYDPDVEAPRYIARKRAGINDVAKLAGVSRQTVTRAMNDMPEISEATKARVLHAARQLRYRPSRFGRGLAKASVTSLGLVVVDLTNTYYAQLASSVIDAATTQGWTVLVTEWNGDLDALDQLHSQVDVVIGHFSLPTEKLDRIFGDMPLVSLDSQSGPDSRASVDFDFVPGMTTAIAHLDEIGRDRIAMLDFSLDKRPSERRSVLEELLDARGDQLTVVATLIDHEPGIDSGRAAMGQLLGRHPQIDSVVAFNDSVAIGAVKEIQARGMQIPDDIAVIGIDGLPIGQIITPELTTLELDIKNLGQTAVQMLAAMLVGDLPLRGVEVHRRVAHTLVVRGSA